MAGRDKIILSPIELDKIKHNRPAKPEKKGYLASIPAKIGALLSATGSTMQRGWTYVSDSVTNMTWPFQYSYSGLHNFNAI